MPILTVITPHQTATIDCDKGSILRDVLLESGFSPYTSLTRIANCGGRGLCATCGVWIESGETTPQHWHDRLASQFGYPRLSCQIVVDDDMTIRILQDKIIWGGRDANRAGTLKL